MLVISYHTENLARLGGVRSSVGCAARWWNTLTEHGGSMRLCRLSDTTLSTDSLQYTIQLLASHHLIPPHLILDALGIGEQTEVWTRLNFQPLEIVNLIPVIRALQCLRTCQYLRHGCKSHPLAILDDGPTRRMEVDVYVLRGVHTELSTRSYEHTIRHVSDVNGSRHLTADDQRVANVPQIQCRERRSCRGS
jgi:hypothetical protein